MPIYANSEIIQSILDTLFVGGKIEREQQVFNTATPYNGSSFQAGISYYTATTTP